MTTMTMTEVDSSNIHSIGYAADEETLGVRFKNKAGEPTTLYEYDGVPDSIHRELMDAPSVGRYFNQNIRGTFDGRKVEDQ